APSATPGAVAPDGRGGGGGSAPSAPAAETKVIFSGRAYPLSKVYLLKDAQFSAQTVAGPDAKFEIELAGITEGNYVFTIYGEDADGRRSAPLAFPIALSKGATTRVSGLFIAPTISVDKSEVRRGDDIAIFGRSAPNADIVIAVHSNEEQFVSTASDRDGAYLYNFDTTPLDLGEHSTKSKARAGTDVSPFGNAVAFVVGTKTVDAQPKQCPAKADVNGDCKVNLVDFSIAAYWYKRPLSADFQRVEKEQLNGDGTVTLVDFSIMAYYWTGI
ncbi:MAG: hypothetical protein AAB932_04450, partial [Patescibacteria group bacterium]